MYHIFHDIDINCFRDELFKAISTPSGLNSWWTVKSSGTPGINEEYEFYFSEEFQWYARVLEINEPESITYQVFDADQDWTNTLLSFEILATENKNQHKLRFEHRNWSSINAHYRQTSFCWALYLNELKKNLETGFHNA